MMPRSHGQVANRFAGAGTAGDRDTADDMDPQSDRTGGGGARSNRRSSNKNSVQEQIRQRYAHHGMQTGMGFGGAADSSAMSAAAVMGDFGIAGFQTHNMNMNNMNMNNMNMSSMNMNNMNMNAMNTQLGFSTPGSLGSFSHMNPGMNMNLNCMGMGMGMHPNMNSMNMNAPGGGMNMNSMCMTPNMNNMNVNPHLMDASMYMGSPSAAAMAGLHHQQFQPQAAIGAGLGDSSGAGATGREGASERTPARESSAASGGVSLSETGGPVSQSEREEDLLLNLLIARRQRGSLPGQGSLAMGPQELVAGGGGQPTSWADDFARLRGQVGAGVGSGDAGFDGDTNQRAQASARMGMNMGNMAGAAELNQQFFSESRSRQRGSGMGLPMGSSPSYNWMGGNAAPGMHSLRGNGKAIDANYSASTHHRMNDQMNTQLGIDVLERADRALPGGGMIHDARTAEQESSMGENCLYNGGGGRGSLFDAAAVSYSDMRRQSLNVMGPDKVRRVDGDQPSAKKKRMHKKKPADMPRRPLSAYNLFFSEERARILKEIEGTAGEEEEEEEGKKEDGKPQALLRPLLPSEKKRRPHRKTHGKISFQQLAQKVGARWKALSDDQRKKYQDLAKEDMARQKEAMEQYHKKQAAQVESKFGETSTEKVS